MCLFQLAVFSGAEDRLLWLPDPACVDHIIVLGEAPLRRILKSCAPTALVSEVASIAAPEVWPCLLIQIKPDR
jgi:hypothetical protein